MNSPKIALYVDLFFCIVILPLIIMLVPVEKWIVAHTAFVVTLIAYLYALYFTYRVTNIPLLFMRRKYGSIILLIILLVGVTKLFTYFPLPEAPDAKLPLDFRRHLYSQTVWFFFLIVSGFSLAIEVTFELFRQMFLKQEIEAQKNKAELALYKAQINPHFLFNTLESARSLAHHYHAQPVEQLIGGMSRMFRYSIYAPPAVPLEDELGQLGGYFSVMDIRFPGCFKVLEDIEPETLSWPVLPMLLQPLAENVLTHAFPNRRGNLLVQSFIQNGRLHVRIADNGMGIARERLDQIIWTMKHTDGETASEHPEGNVQGGTIGLPNIYRRLKLTFGDHAHLLLRSKEGYYTVVELVIPDRQFGLSDTATASGTAPAEGRSQP